MKNKFNIGDKVQTKAGKTFVISSIYTGRHECAYGGYAQPSTRTWDESVLTLFEKPKPKRKLYQWAFKITCGPWYFIHLALCEEGLDSKGAVHFIAWNEIEKKKVNPDFFIEVDAL